MSIAIYAQVNAAKIDQKRWEKVYEDCLKIAEAGQLADMEARNVRGFELNCLVPAKEKDGKIHIIGDMIQGSCVQDYELERDVSRYLPKDADADFDPPVADYLYHVFRDEDNVYDKYFTPYFGTQTFGTRPHIYLLAMACLITSEFPDAAVVYGDISYKQCCEACIFAEKIVGYKVKVPIEYDYIKLFIELYKRGYRGYEMLERYLTVYKGTRCDGFKKVLKKHFTDEQFISYFLKHPREELFDDLKAWLELGLSLDGLCEFYKNLPDGENAKALADALVLGKVHQKHKSKRELYDFTNVPDELYMVDDQNMAQARKNAKEIGFKRRRINAYIPLYEMKEAIKKHFPKDDVERFFADALAEKGAAFQRQKIIEAFYTAIDKEARKMENRGADIVDPVNLYNWKSEETTLDVTVVDQIKIIFDIFYKLGLHILEDYPLEDIDKRKRFIVTCIKKTITLTQTAAENIIDSMEDDKYSALYVGLLVVNKAELYDSPIVNSVLMNPEFYDFVMKMLREGSDEKCN